MSLRKKIAIYLAGKIAKGHEKIEGFHWGENELDTLRKQLPQYELFFLNPADRLDDLSDQHSVFGRDMCQVFCSDVVFADARERRGLGVGAEMMWAKCNRIPVVTFAPQQSFYRQSNAKILDQTVQEWVHPFVESLSDQIVDSLSEGANWIDQFMKGLPVAIKGRESIESAMRYYLDSRLDADLPMRTNLEAYSELRKRLENALSSISSTSFHH